MTDIAKCSGTNCTKKESCYRYTAKTNKFRQSYFTEVPLKDNNECDYYWPNKVDKKTESD